MTAETRNFGFTLSPYTNTNTNKTPVMNFGKHEGMRITHVPLSYLQWLIRESNNKGQDIQKDGINWRDEAERELQRRGDQFDTNGFEVSLHAINRYSTRCIEFWDAKTPLVNWIKQMANDAITKGKQVKSQPSSDGPKITVRHLDVDYTFACFPDRTAHTLVTVYNQRRPKSQQ